MKDKNISIKYTTLAENETSKSKRINFKDVDPNVEYTFSVSTELSHAFAICMHCIATLIPISMYKMT